MSLKSKESRASTGQKFWQLKKFTLGHQPESISQDTKIPAEPTNDSDSLESTKPKNKRLSSLLSHHRRQASPKQPTKLDTSLTPLLSPRKTSVISLPAVMLAQDVGHQQHHNQNNNSQQQNSQQENRPSPARVRQRTMSQTVTGSLPGLPKDQKHQRPSTVRKTDGQRSIRRIVSLASHRSVIAPEVFEPDPRPTQRKPLDSASEEDSDEQLSKDPPVRKMSPDLRRVPKTDKDDTPKYTLKDTPVRLNNTEPSTDDAPIIRRSSKASDDYGYKERLQQRARTLRPAASLATLRQLAQPMGEELPTRPATSFRRSFSQDEEAASWRLHHPHSPPHSPRTSGARPLVRSDTAHSMRTLTRRANAREDLQGWSANNLNNRATDQNDTDAPLDSSMNSEASWWSGQPSDEDEHRPDTDASSDSSENSPCSRRHIDTVDQLRAALDQDKAVIKALQGQKEACNRDIAFLSQNIDLLSTEAADWKKKWETEKLQKEQCKEELASVVRKLAETSDKVRHLTGTNEDLKRDLEKCRQQDTKEEPRDQCADDNSTKMDQLKAQLELSQDQVRVLKATMEQFLRMGIFSSDLAQGSACVYDSTSDASFIKAVVRELRYAQLRQRQAEPNACVESVQKSILTTNEPLVLSDTPAPKDEETEQSTAAELDVRLRELLLEKELLQAEYSKIPVSGGNALTRRRREELEDRLDRVDSQMSKIKLWMRHRNVLYSSIG